MTAASPMLLQIAVEEPRVWARRLTITVPAQRIEAERQEVARRWSQRVKLPGFRKGRVPPHVLERQYGSAIEHETLERVVGTAYREALAQENFRPISQGEVGKLDYQPGTDLTFSVEFEVRPELALGRIGGFRVRRETRAVSEADLERVLERLRHERAEWQPVTEAAQSGDLAAVEIQTLGTTEEPRRYHIVLGEDQAVPDLEDAIRTLAPGADGEFTIRTEGAGGALGEPQQVRVKLLELRRPELPALDDEFARRVGEFDNVEALRARIREDLERELEAEAERGVRRALVEHIVEANPFELPDAMVNAYLERLIRPREGADPERVAEMKTATRPAAEQALKRLLVIERIAEREGLSATAEELESRLAQLAERHGRPIESLRAQLEKNGQLRTLEEEITEDKVFEFLKSKSTIE